MEREISINSSREGILTINEDVMTIISDQQIDVGDTLNSILHKDKENKFIPIHVDEIIEERPSVGEWKQVPPPVWRKIKFHKG